MPSSRTNLIPTIIHLIKQVRPASILDVGVGFGKWGHLFREYTDIIASEHEPARYHRDNWQVRIDGIEGFPDYLTPMHHFLYDQIHVGDMCQLIRTLPTYDVIFLGDVIEHVDKETGHAFLRDCVAHTHKAVIISTPKFETNQGILNANDLECHHSLWSERDFAAHPGCIAKAVDGATLVAVIVKAGVDPPICEPERHVRAAPADPPQRMSRPRRFARWLLVRLLGWRNFQRLQARRQDQRA